MNRLDDVIGAGFWEDSYVPGENSVMCRLTIELPDGRKVTKADAGGYAGMPDAGDDDKSGFSDAFKRAAARFGVGRYLYGDGMPHNVREAMGEVIEPGRGGPSQSHAAPTDGQHQRDRQTTAPQGGQRRDNAPRTGRALFAWLRENEEKHDVGLIKYINSWAKLQDFPGRIVDFDAEHVSLAYAEATRKLQSVGPGAAAAYEEALAN